MFGLKQAKIIIFLCLLLLSCPYTFAAEGDYSSYIEEANNYFHNGQYQETISLLNKALSIDPSGFLANAKMGATYMKMGEFEKAVPYFKKALAVRPDDDATNFGLGGVYLTLDQPDVALNYLRKVHNKELLPQTHFSIGSAYLKLKRYDEAITYFNKSLAGGYNDPILYLGLGTSQYYLRQYDQARKNLLKAKEMYRVKGNNKAVENVDSFLSTIPQN